MTTEPQDGAMVLRGALESEKQDQEALVLVSNTLANLLPNSGEVASKKARQFAGENVALVLASLCFGDRLRLSSKARADVAEIALGEHNDEAGKVLMKEHLTDGALIELIAARGDLPAAIAMIAPGDLVIAAILKDIEHAAGNGDSDALQKMLAREVIRSWFIKIQDRDDFDELIEERIAGSSLMDHAIMCVFIDACDDEGVMESMLDEIGISPVSGMERLQEMKDDGLPEFNSSDVTRARMRISDRRKELRDTPIFVQVAASQEEAADELEF